MTLRCECLYTFIIVGDLSETEEERNEAVARKDLEHYEFSCMTYKSIWDVIKQQVDRLHQELKVLAYIIYYVWY